MPEYNNFSSWPPEQEATFVPFEERTVEVGKKASKIGTITAVVLCVVTLAIVLGYWAPIKAVGGEGEGEAKPAAAAVAPAPAPAPSAPAAPASAPATPTP